LGKKKECSHLLIDVEWGESVRLNFSVFNLDRIVREFYPSLDDVKGWVKE
jgi:hypothetical protein